MKRLIIVLLATLSFAGCVEHEEISFRGMVVGTRGCSGVLMDNNMGYIVKLFSPDSIGGTMTSTEGEVMSNIVVLYETPRLIYVRDTIHGTFYLDDKYSRANCGLVWDGPKLPEGVFLQVAVE